MYTAKLFDEATTPITIIHYSTMQKDIAEVKRYAVSVASEFDAPGFDAIRRIEIYADDALVDTIVC